MKKMKRIAIMIFILSLLILSTSCKKNKDVENEIKKEYSIPKELLVVIENIDEVELKLLEIKTELEKSVESEAEKEKIEKQWEGLEKLIKNSHTQVNNYKIKAVEKKANEKQIQKFEEDLNNLTIYAENRDILNTFISNNKMYKDSSYFISLYKDYKAQAMMLKYTINKVYIDGLKNEWDKSIEGIDVVSSEYSEMLKEFNKETKEKDKPSEDEKKKEKNLEKLKLSIDSLKQSLDKKDIKLLEIKRFIAITDLKRVEE